jgi:hypothetical protein
MQDSFNMPDFKVDGMALRMRHTCFRNKALGTIVMKFWMVQCYE